MWVLGACVASLGVVLRIPLRGLFICSLAVAGLDTRYFRTVIASKCGAPSRKPVLIALSIDAIGGLQKLWCSNLTLLIFVVRAYENPAVSTMGLRWVQPKQGPGRIWIGNFTLWLSIICELWGCSITDSGVVFAIASLMMGRVHKSYRTLARYATRPPPWGPKRHANNNITRQLTGALPPHPDAGSGVVQVRSCN